MGNAQPSNDGVAEMPGMQTADASPSLDDGAVHQEIVDASRPQPTVVDDQAALTGGSATTGAQLRGQNAVVSQRTGLSFSADLQPSVRTGISVSETNSAVGSAHSQYYSPDQTFWEDEDVRQSTPYCRGRDRLRRRTHAENPSVVPVVSFPDTDEDFADLVRRSIPPPTTPFSERQEFSRESDLANTLPNRLNTKPRELSTGREEVTSYFTAAEDNSDEEEDSQQWTPPLRRSAVRNERRCDTPRKVATSAGEQTVSSRTTDSIFEESAASSHQSTPSSQTSTVRKERRCDTPMKATSMTKRR